MRVCGSAICVNNEQEEKYYTDFSGQRRMMELLSFYVWLAYDNSGADAASCNSNCVQIVVYELKNNLLGFPNGQIKSSDVGCM